LDEEPTATIAPAPHVIAIEFFSRRGNREELLINSQDLLNPLEGKSRWFNYSFSRPVYLTGIEILTDGYSTYDRFEIIVDHIDGTKHEERVGIDAGIVRLRLGKLCYGFRFKPDKKYFSDPKLLRVVATGFSEDEFHQFELHIKEFQKRTEALTKREAKLEEDQEEFTELSADRIELESTVGKSRAEAEQLAKSIATTKDQLQKQQERLADVQAKFTAADEKYRGIQVTIGKEETRLRLRTH
jgi:hypothetical protein